MKRSLILLETALDAMDEGMAVHDAGGGLLFANAGARQLLSRLFMPGEFHRNTQPAPHAPQDPGAHGAPPFHLDHLPASHMIRSGQPCSKVTLACPGHRLVLASAYMIARPGSPWHGCIVSTFVDVTELVANHS